MKKTLFLFFLVSQCIWSQQHDPRQDMMNFNPGKIIVKLKDNVNAKISYTSKGVGTTSENISTTVLFYNDVPMEIVSEFLGHSNIVIMQESYGKLVHKKVSEVIKNLAEKLKFKIVS
jgi:hypothetical protein